MACFHIAKSDEVLHPREERFLAAVAKRFGMTDTEFAYIKARHVSAPSEIPELSWRQDVDR